MKIAIDLRPLQIGHQNRGIGAYLLNLLQRLPGDPSLSYIFLRYNTSKPLEDFLVTVPCKYKEVVLKKYRFSKHPIKLLQYGMAGLLPVYGKILKHRPDVFFQSDYLLGAPKGGQCRTVTVAHDLIPLKFKQIYLPHWTKFFGFRQFRFRGRIRLMLRAWFYGKKYQHGASLLRRSDAIISVSRNTTADLVSLLGVQKSRIHTIYSAASFRNNEQEDIIRPDVKARIDAIKIPFLTYIGGTDLRRQVDELVFAFNLFNARVSDLALVLCGNEFETGSTEINAGVKQAINHSSYNQNIFNLGRITEAEKKYILTKAAAFVYPTLYEGFGLPLLEAMQCGTPIISYKNSSIPEITGDTTLYTNGIGSYPLYLAFQKLFATPEIWKKNAIKGQLQAARFSWEACAKETWKIVQTQGLQ